MISSEFYNRYFNAILDGDRAGCTKMVQELLDQGIEIKLLYRQLFEKTLYQVGELWERNQISVAKEHLVTAITENLLNLVYPHLFRKKTVSKKAVICSAANEYHQVGGKMVADIMELNGWDTYFLGANIPVDQVVSFIDEKKPDLVGLSLSIYFNFPSLKKEIEAIQAHFPDLDIIVGGQAFKWGKIPSLDKFKNLTYLSSLDELENQTRITDHE